MTKQEFNRLEAYMCACAGDSAHDREHIYRVLNNALIIAREEPEVDYEVLITACLLHDVGRQEQFADPSVCHAQAGAEKARQFLLELGMEDAFTEKVCSCILTHRFRKNRPPESTEAKILFDADKLDVTGALGIARTLMYKGDRMEPLYTRLPDGTVSDGSLEDAPSFFREYRFKLEKLYDRFYTAAGARLALQRREAAQHFYESLLAEITSGELLAAEKLQRLLQEGKRPVNR